MRAVRPADEERLPWLEPYREAGPRRPATGPVKRGRPGLVAGSLVLLLAVGGTGYWLGRQAEAPRPIERPAATVALPAPEPRPVAPAASEGPPALPAEPPAAEVAAAEARPEPPPAKTISRPAQKPRAAKRREVARSAKRASAVRPWPKMPSPGPPGQVIQLGAFSTPGRAYSAYNSRVARYPLLARMPRVVVPVVSGRRQRVLYVLRLGTVSRQQSNIVCRNLRASGDHCLVIG